MKPDGAVYNHISVQYMDMIQDNRNDKRNEMRSVFYWAMSVIAGVYWYYRGRIAVDAQVIANEQEMSVLFADTWLSRLYKRSLDGLDANDVKEMLEMFVEAFNTVDMLVGAHFHADGPKQVGSVNVWSCTQGQMRIDIHIDALEKW